MVTLAELAKLLLYYISFLRILAITFQDATASNIVLLNGDAGGIGKAFIMLHQFIANSALLSFNINESH